jgi:hypothetical protein
MQTRRFGRAVLSGFSGRRDFEGSLIIKQRSDSVLINSSALARTASVIMRGNAREDSASIAGDTLSMMHERVDSNSVATPETITVNKLTILLKLGPPADSRMAGIGLPHE